jgi:hypothetical protein
MVSLDIARHVHFKNMFMHNNINKTYVVKGFHVHICAHCCRGHLHNELTARF